MDRVAATSGGERWTYGTAIIRGSTPSGLELLRCQPSGPPVGPSVLCVHGAFSGAWCWAEHFLEAFAQAGYPAWAVSLRGHGASVGRARLMQHSLEDYVSDLRAALSCIPGPVVLVGHSMGGFVVQRLLTRVEAWPRSAIAGAVLMASVPPTGLLWPAAWVAITQPMLAQRLALMATGGPRLAALLGSGRQSIDRALLATDVADKDRERYMTLFQGESQRVALDMSSVDPFLACRVPSRLPMLILGAERDLLVPRSVVAMTGLTYSRPWNIVPRLAHVMMLEAEWERAMSPILTWLKRWPRLGADPV
ncbi:MAG: alpha/beta fold hydrolase [Myxococcota bacterium]